MPRRAEARRPVSCRLLGRLADERLVALVRRGDRSAFEELFDRHSGGVLSFCTRVLGSPEEGEDAHQYAFLAVYQAIGERSFEPQAFKPWLYTIARNRCLSMLRSRREGALEVLGGEEDSVAGTEQTADRVEEQAEVREILSDLRDLPELQRAALLLSEFGDLSHAQIAQVVDCPREKVKSLVFQARATLSLGRVARETPCSWVREQMAGWPRGSRLPVALRRHLKRCEGCSEFEGEIRRRRRLIAIALPVAPSIGLKRSVLAAVGGGSGGGLVAKGASLSGASGGVVGEAACGGLGAALATKAGLVVAATAGVAAVGVGVVGLAGAGGIEKPPREQDSGQRTSASEGRSGAPERQTSSSPAVVGPGDTAASQASSGAPARQTTSSHPVVGRREGRARGRRRPERPSQAPARRTSQMPTAPPPVDLPRVGGSLETLRAESAPVPDLGLAEPTLDLGGPVPDLGLAGPKPDLGLLGQPVPGLGVGEVNTGLPGGR